MVRYAPFVGLVSLVFFLGFPSARVEAVPTSFNTGTLTFDSPTQSIWGPGGSASFGGSGFVLGNSVTGISYSASASTGTVSSSVRGSIGVGYDNRVGLPAASDFELSIDWLTGASRFQSDLGANIRIAGHLFDIINDFTIFERDYGLNISESFSSETPVTVMGSDDFSPASVSVGLPTGGVGLSGEAGVDLDIQEDATVSVQRVSGTLRATHGGSGETRDLPFNLDMTSAEMFMMDLGRRGSWDFDFLNVMMFGTYSGLFSMELNPFIGGGIGVFCGDPFDPNDNFLCATEGGEKTDELIGVDLFTSPTIMLDFNEFASLSGFSVTVVPEPATLSLFSLGVALVLGARRRRTKTGARRG